jgi:hypothetical protein
MEEGTMSGWPPEQDCVVSGKSHAVDRTIADTSTAYANHDELGDQAVVEADPLCMAVARGASRHLRLPALAARNPGVFIRCEGCPAGDCGIGWSAGRAAT